MFFFIDTYFIFALHIFVLKLYQNVFFFSETNGNVFFLIQINYNV